MKILFFLVFTTGSTSAFGFGFGLIWGSRRGVLLLGLKMLVLVVKRLTNCSTIRVMHWLKHLITTIRIMIRLHHGTAIRIMHRLTHLSSVWIMQRLNWNLHLLLWFIHFIKVSFLTNLLCLFFNFILFVFYFKLSFKHFLLTRISLRNTFCSLLVLL